jgi:hypothetical protein
MKTDLKAKGSSFLRKETKEEYFARLEKSLEDLENGNVVVMNRDTFEIEQPTSDVSKSKMIATKKAIQFFKTIQNNLGDFRFDRDEANER